MECSVYGCLRSVYRRQPYCSVHYKRVRKNGGPGSPRIVYRWGDVCTALDCSRAHDNMGYCTDHLRQHKECLKEVEPVLLCSKCRTNPRDAPHSKGLDGLHAWCRSCQAANTKRHNQTLDPTVRKERDRVQALRKRNMTIEQYDRMFADQNGLCAICENPETRKNFHTGDIVALHVDHNHVTNVVRSLLCGRCNTGIGMLKDDPEIAMRAALYLKHFHGNAAPQET